MRGVLPVALALLMLGSPIAIQTQTTDDASVKNAKQARAALDAMVQAMGGQAWLTMKNQMLQGHLAAGRLAFSPILISTQEVDHRKVTSKACHTARRWGWGSLSVVNLPPYKNNRTPFRNTKFVILAI